MKTTLNHIRAFVPCTSGWTKLLAHLGKTKADDEPLSILTILKSNGLDDALWCLRAVEVMDKEIRLLTVSFARQVQHLMTDPRSLEALDVAERFANGLATQDELAAANAASNAAAYAAANTANATAMAAARAAYAAYAAANTANATAMAAARAAYAAKATTYAAYAAYAANAAMAAAWAADDAARVSQTTLLIAACKAEVIS